MCWKDEWEFYNNGQAFKLTCRDKTGVIVTLIADNYFGYCKKEVKTQISYAANLYGLCEEEHAGGALVFPAYDLGEEFSGDVHVKRAGHSFAEVSSLYREFIELKPEGYAVDKKYPDIIYVPEDARFDLDKQRITWPGGKSGCAHQAAARQDLRPPLGLQGPHGKARPGTAPGGWWARWRKASCATNPAPFPAAANPRFPNPSPTPFSPGRCLSPISKRILTRWPS